MNKTRQNTLLQSAAIRRDQLVTLSDLADFKTELLEDLKKVSKEFHSGTNKEWLKSYEVRKLLGISPGTLQTLRNNGTIRFTRIGNVIFYNIEDIKAMMEKFKNKVF